VLFNYLSRYRDANFNRVLAPEGEILSFASPKESIQRKGDPDAACYLRSGVFVRLCQKGHGCPFWQSAASLPRPFGLFPTKTPVLGAAYGNLSWSA
jgi:hypothetical protein